MGKYLHHPTVHYILTTSEIIELETGLNIPTIFAYTQPNQRILATSCPQMK